MIRREAIPGKPEPNVNINRFYLPVSVMVGTNKAGEEFTRGDCLQGLIPCSSYTPELYTQERSKNKG